MAVEGYVVFPLILGTSVFMPCVASGYAVDDGELPSIFILSTVPEHHTLAEDRQDPYARHSGENGNHSQVDA